MIQATLQQLQAVIAGGQIHPVSAGAAAFCGLSTDSRQIEAGALFVALRGEHFDAHDFLPSVVEAGAAALIVERLPQGISLPALVVPDTKQALIQIARFWRQQFDLPVIGVTGSNGKTTVKEMIASILRSAFGAEHMIATKGNLNNEIGVPLTLIRLAHTHQAAVIELGMNHPGEIALLSTIAYPTVALVNNAQREHQEFMQSVEAVAIENGAVLQNLPDSGVAVFPADDAHTELWRAYAQERGQRQMLRFGLNPDADVYATISPLAFGSEMEIHVAGRSVKVQLAAAGQHNVLNALAATACCFALGISLEKIALGLENFAPVAGRLQPKTAACGARIIDDTYNANPDSVKAAIDVLAGSNAVPKGGSLLVLGDMGEVGQDGAAFHTEIGTYAKTCGVAHLYTLGQLAQASSVSFGGDARHFDDIESLLTCLKAQLTAEQTVLVKGSRFMKMERVVASLMHPVTGKN